METLFTPLVDDNDPYAGMTKKEIRERKAAEKQLHKILDGFDRYFSSFPKRAKAHFDKHPFSKKKIDEFITDPFQDKVDFHKLFKYLFHVSVRTYRHQKRMEAAARLLRRGKLSHKQIASLSGYSNVNTFNRAFKKKMQLTPTQYVNKN